MFEDMFTRFMFMFPRVSAITAGIDNEGMDILVICFDGEWEVTNSEDVAGAMNAFTGHWAPNALFNKLDNDDDTERQGWTGN